MKDAERRISDASLRGIEPDAEDIRLYRELRRRLGRLNRVEEHRRNRNVQLRNTLEE